MSDKPDPQFYPWWFPWGANLALIALAIALHFWLYRIGFRENVGEPFANLVMSGLRAIGLF